MAKSNVIGAVRERWEGLTAANFPSSTVPPIDLGVMPATTAAGAQQYTPYAIIRDGGMRPEFDTEHNVIEPSELAIEVYGNGDDGPQIVEAAKYNGGAINAGLGLDFATLSFATGTGKRVSFQMVRTGEQWDYAGFERDGQRIYVCFLSYRAVTRRTL